MGRFANLLGLCDHHCRTSHGVRRVINVARHSGDPGTLRPVFRESEIPWDELAFSSGRYALGKYLKDRELGRAVNLVNIITPKDEITRFQRGFDNTIRAAFAGCATTRLSRPLIPVVAELYECQASAVDDYHMIYRDSGTRASIDSSSF